MPDNIVEATFRQHQTKYDRSQAHLGNTTVGNKTVTEIVYIVTKLSGKTDGVNILGIIWT